MRTATARIAAAAARSLLRRRWAAVGGAVLILGLTLAVGTSRTEVVIAALPGDGGDALRRHAAALLAERSAMAVRQPPAESAAVAALASGRVHAVAADPASLRRALGAGAEAPWTAVLAGRPWRLLAASGAVLLVGTGEIPAAAGRLLAPDLTPVE